MHIIKRTVLDQLVRELNSPESSILLGPRQVGKTFLLKELKKIAEKQGLKTTYYNLEIPNDLIQFNKPDPEVFDLILAGGDVVFIDEFHYLKNALKILKAIFDSGKKIKIFVSGSSSIEIHKHLKESLSGRRFVSIIAPLSFEEFRQKPVDLDMAQRLEEYLIYGGMPGLINIDDIDQKIRMLNEILEAYIQKDIKSLVKEENIRAFNNLLYLLAQYQGSLISENNLSKEIGLTAAAVNRYLSILEKTYICHRVYSYSRNLANELKKSQKIYLFDLGIRAALLKDFSTVDLRPDKGALYETFVLLQVLGIMKPNMEIKFWRNRAGLEIDFILLKDRKPFLIEAKTTINGLEIPKAFKVFIDNYPSSLGGLIVSKNIEGEIEYSGKKILFRKYENLLSGLPAARQG